MKEFLMLFWEAKTNEMPAPEEFQEMIKEWNHWIGGIAAQGKLVGTEALDYSGKTISATGVVTDGPHAEIKEMVGGYLICKASDIDEAVKLSEGCPIFHIGGSVEVRPIMELDS